MRSIDIASFTCNSCGHRCTPPEAINAISNEMERMEVTHLPDETAELARLAELRAKHRGNGFVIERKYKTDKDDPSKLVLDRQIIKVQRSYAKVVYQSATSLEESDEITLACPECDAVLYTVKFGPLPGEGRAVRRARRKENEHKALATALEQIKKQGGDIDEAEALRKAGLQKVKLPNGGFKLVGL